MTPQVQTVADLLRSRASAPDADEAAVRAFVKNDLPAGWMVDFDHGAADWTATVLHSREPAGWPAFTMFRSNDVVGFVSLWPCGSHVACFVDDLETALRLTASGIFAAAEGRYGAVKELSAARH